MFELEPETKLKFKSNPILRFAIFDNKHFKVYLEGQIFERENLQIMLIHASAEN